MTISNFVVRENGRASNILKLFLAFDVTFENLAIFLNTGWGFISIVPGSYFFQILSHFHDLGN